MINYNLIMYMGIAFYILVMIGFIVLIGVYLMKANQLFIDEQNRKYSKAINKVKPKLNKWKYYYT